MIFAYFIFICTFQFFYFFNISSVLFLCPFAIVWSFSNANLYAVFISLSTHSLTAIFLVAYSFQSSFSVLFVTEHPFYAAALSTNNKEFHLIASKNQFYHLYLSLTCLPAFSICFVISFYPITFSLNVILIFLFILLCFCFFLFISPIFLFSFILSYLSFYDFLPLVLSFFLCMLISVLSFFVLVSFSLFRRSYFLFLCYSYFLFNLPFFLIFLSIMSIWYFICYFFILLHPVFASFSSFIHFACFFFHSLLPFYFRNDSIFITFLLNFLFFHSFPFVLSQNFFCLSL